MNALTVRFPGMEPVILRRAAEQGITEEEAWAQRERQAEQNLAEAEALLEILRPAGACEAPIPAFGKTCGEMFPADPARRVRGAWACDLHAGHECPAALSVNGDAR